MRKLFIFILASFTIGLQAQVNQFSGDTVRNSVAIKLLVGNDGIGVDTTNALRVSANANALAITYHDTNYVSLTSTLINTDSIRAGAIWMPCYRRCNWILRHNY